MKKLLNLTVFTTILLLLSCSKDGIDEQIENQSEQIENQHDDQISTEVIEKLKSLELNPEGVYKKDFTLPDGSIETNYVIEGDITMTHDELFSLNTPQPYKKKEMIQSRYRTNNLVNVSGSASKVIYVKGITGGSRALTPFMRAALREAIDAYNQDISTVFQFELSFGASESGLDNMVVYMDNNSSPGGSAGFPSGGQPYKYVRINSGTSPSPTIYRHIIMHEIGHCLGLRHTDWATRQSCGSGSSGESANPPGAIHIPGTPTGYDASSLMLACFNSNSTGSFDQYDKVALEYLYPTASF